MARRTRSGPRKGSRPAVTAKAKRSRAGRYVAAGAAAGTLGGAGASRRPPAPAVGAPRLRRSRGRTRALTTLGGGARPRTSRPRAPARPPAARRSPPRPVARRHIARRRQQQTSSPARTTARAARPRTRMAAKGAAPKGGFRSKAQWRWAFATRKPWARKAAHKTKGGPRARYRRLPSRKGAPTARTLR